MREIFFLMCNIDHFCNWRKRMSCVLVNGGRDRFGRGAPENRTINQTKGKKAKKKRKNRV